MSRLKKKLKDKISDALSGVDAKFVNRDELDSSESIRKLDESVDYRTPGDSLSFGNLHVTKRFKNYKMLR